MATTKVRYACWVSVRIDMGVGYIWMIKVDKVSICVVL